MLALTGCAGQEDSSRGLPWWAILLLLVALIVVVWVIIRVGRKKAEEPELAEPKAEKVIAHQPIEPDNLTLIEGIGPKTQAVLQAAGIQTFAQLADLAPEKIKELLTEPGLRLGVTDTWPKQADLAVQGKMDELKALWYELQGGRLA